MRLARVPDRGAPGRVRTSRPTGAGRQDRPGSDPGRAPVSVAPRPRAIRGGCHALRHACRKRVAGRPPLVVRRGGAQRRAGGAALQLVA
ncbi:hypothetical protein G6F57_020432 [Rhizopus arrhizus]|nr:hypothetical protein G6F57_020432 [Rhizopus arrhizus]